VPLVIAEGAGMMSRRGVGTAVFGGMLAAAVLGIFLIPLLYVVFQWMREKVKGSGGGNPRRSIIRHRRRRVWLKGALLMVLHAVIVGQQNDLAAAGGHLLHVGDGLLVKLVMGRDDDDGDVLVDQAMGPCFNSPAA
jgi:hypothetical protein